MKIVHIAPNSPYNDQWGYQENLLPKYHKKLGHEVTLIVSDMTHRDGGVASAGTADYIREDGVRVIRLKRKKYTHRVITNLMARIQVFPSLCELRPDFIFFHGLVSSSILDAVRYKKKINPECVIVQDNHSDYYNSMKASSFKERLIREFYRKINRKSIPYVQKVYGVTPWRKTYAEDYFRIPPEKTDVLIMGADDEKIDWARRGELRKEIRQRYGVSEGDFLVVTGGKIDRTKNIHLLMEACGKLEGVRLLIFGKVEPDIQEQFSRELKKSRSIVHVGWIPAERVYDYFFAADLAVFPGTHSVLWEQACAAKVPCVFAQWDGIEHLNRGGSCEFIDSVDPEKLRERIVQLRFTPRYESMRQVADSEATDAFLYGRIAIKSLEQADEMKR